MYEPERKIPRAKLIIASIIILLSFSSAAFIPLILMLPVSDEMKAALSGLMVIGIPQLLTGISIVIVGKEGFTFLKQKFFGILKKSLPLDHVSRTRYFIGLIMFTIPLLMAWALPYTSDYIPFYEAYKYHISIAGDLMLLTSFFVLGGNFWDKLRSLFVYRSRAVFPDNKQQKPQGHD